MSLERLKLVLGLCCTAQFSVCTHMPRLAAGLSGLFRAHLSAACSIDFSHACWRTCAGDRLTSFGCGLPHAAVSGLRASAVSLRDTSYTLHVSLKTRSMGLCAIQHSFEISQRTEALKVFTEMCVDDCQDYQKLKEALFTTYAVVPEVYRKRFII